MKKIKVVALALMVFFIGYSSVFAECSATDSNRLTNLARQVKASYELKTKEEKVEGDGFPDGLTPEEQENYYITLKYYTIYISNITEDLYVEVNDGNESKKYYYSDSQDGTISFDQEDTSTLHQYTITVYSSDNTGDCVDKQLYTLPKLTTPYYNSYSASSFCNDIKEFYLCYDYLSIDNYPDYNEFYRLVNQYLQGKINEEGEEITPPEEKKENSFVKFIKKNKKTIIITSTCLIIVAAGAVATVIIVKRKKEIEK